MELGVGYWIIADADKSWKVDNPVVTTRTLLTRTNSSVGSVKTYHDALLPDLQAGVTKKIMMGNPFPRAFQWSDLQLYDTAASAFPSTLYNATGYVYDTASTSGQPYSAITVSTPGTDHEVKPYQGFWIKDLGALDYSGLKLGLPFVK